MKNSITFIIPSIGRNSLNNTIQSLMNQTNPNWKCIIIYDGVTPNHIYNDERIKFISIGKLGENSSHHGMSGLVRNEGLKICNTEWIGFVDDDDTIDIQYVETLFSEYTDYDFVIWRMQYPNGQILPRTNQITFGNVGISFCFKNKFPNLFFDKNRDGEDLDFLIKLEKLTKNYIFSPHVYYRINH